MRRIAIPIPLRTLRAPIDEVESELERGWDKARAASKLTWQQAKHATRDAWERVEGAIPGDSDNDGK